MGGKPTYATLEAAGREAAEPAIRVDAELPNELAEVVLDRQSSALSTPIDPNLGDGIQ
jgi:hypothetical protein